MDLGDIMIEWHSGASHGFTVWKYFVYLHISAH
jgi:hypothetical protein